MTGAFFMPPVGDPHISGAVYNAGMTIYSTYFLPGPTGGATGSTGTFYPVGISGTTGSTGLVGMVGPLKISRG
jgi:hypothetical protein